MPLDSGAFDLVVCRAAFKNFREPVRALDEMHRVLRPGGEALIIDLRKGVRPEAIDAYVAGMGLGRFDAFLPRLIFRPTLIPRAYTSGRFREMAAASAFGGCRIDESAIGLNVTLRR